MLKVLFMTVPILLAYGTKGMATRKEMGLSNTFPCIISGFLSCFFLIALTIVGGMPGPHDMITYVILIGTPILYIGYIIYARLWAKKYTALLEEEKAQKREEELAQKVRDKMLAAAREQKKAAQKQRLAQALASGEIDVHYFAEIASDCKNFIEILTLWDSSGLTPDSPIRDELLSYVKTERMYGSSPRELANFLNGLLQVKQETIQLSEERRKREET